MAKSKEKNRQKAGKVLMIPVEQIEASPYQARTTFDDTEIAALAVSILQNGLLQPVSVRRAGVHKYQLVAGERRLRACRLAKLEKVPAILADYDDSESAALGLLENLQRAQLDPFDAARGIREVIRLWGCTQAEAARRLGLSQSALANKLRLLTLTTAQQQLCVANHLTERHARAVLRLPEGRRTAALEKMAREAMSVRDADKLVDAMLAAPKAGPSPLRRTVPMVRDVRLFVNTLQHAVDMMAAKGIAATTTCGQKDGCLEYTVRIPVHGEAGAGEGFAVVPVPMQSAGASAPVTRNPHRMNPLRRPAPIAPGTPAADGLALAAVEGLSGGEETGTAASAAEGSAGTTAESVAGSGAAESPVPVAAAAAGEGSAPAEEPLPPDLPGQQDGDEVPLVVPANPPGTPAVTPGVPLTPAEAPEGEAAVCL